VLIAGGTTSYGACAGVSESEIYNPDTQTFRLSGKLNPGRHQVADVLLNNGQVLVAGGSNCGSSAMRNAGLYTAGDGAFTATGALNTARSLAAGVLLPSNLQALIVGGINGGRTAELFDTSNNTFRPTLGLMQEQRDYTAVTALLNTGTGFDGDILVAGGVPPGTGNSGGKLLELYDPSRGTFSPAGSMSVPRSLFTVTEFRKVAP
jgi:hypothetical protein